MRIVAFDLETTGVDPQKDQILEIGAVCFETNTGETLGEFETLVSHERYIGSAYALQMNQALLKRLARGQGVSERRAIQGLNDALFDWGFSLEHKAVPVGFNVGSFDIAFYNKSCKATGELSRFSHGAIELGSLLMGSTKSTTRVGSAQGVKMLGEGRTVAHTALQDARDAKDLYMLAMGE